MWLTGCLSSDMVFILHLHLTFMSSVATQFPETIVMHSMQFMSEIIKKVRMIRNTVSDGEHRRAAHRPPAVHATVQLVARHAPRVRWGIAAIPAIALPIAAHLAMAETAHYVRQDGGLTTPWTWAPIAVCVAIAFCASVLSFRAIREVAVAYSAVTAKGAWAIPFTIDGLELAAMSVQFGRALQGEAHHGATVLMFVMASISVLINVLHNTAPAEREIAQAPAENSAPTKMAQALAWCEQNLNDGVALDDLSATVASHELRISQGTCRNAINQLKHDRRASTNGHVKGARA